MPKSTASGMSSWNWSSRVVRTAINPLRAPLRPIITVRFTNFRSPTQPARGHMTQPTMPMIVSNQAACSLDTPTRSHLKGVYWYVTRCPHCIKHSPNISIVNDRCLQGGGSLVGSWRQFSGTGFVVVVFSILTCLMPRKNTGVGCLSCPGPIPSFSYAYADLDSTFFFTFVFLVQSSNTSGWTDSSFVSLFGVVPSCISGRITISMTSWLSGLSKAPHTIACRTRAPKMNNAPCQPYIEMLSRMRGGSKKTPTL